MSEHEPEEQAEAIQTHDRNRELLRMGMAEREVVQIRLLERIAAAAERIATALERSAEADERAANPLEALSVAMATVERLEAEQTIGRPAQSIVEPPPVAPPAPRREDLPESEQWRLKP